VLFAFSENIESQQHLQSIEKGVSYAIGWQTLKFAHSSLHSASDFNEPSIAILPSPMASSPGFPPSCDLLPSGELGLSLEFTKTHQIIFSSQVTSSSSFLFSQMFTADDRVNGASSTRIYIYVGVGVGCGCFAVLVVGLIVRWLRSHVQQESDEEMSVASGGDQFITHTFMTHEFVTDQVVPFITCLNQAVTTDAFAMLATEMDGWS
jgi:hypothetical protein